MIGANPHHMNLGQPDPENGIGMTDHLENIFVAKDAFRYEDEDHGELIHENSLYSVYVGDPEVSEINGLVYKVVNQMYDLVEMETTVMMRALYSSDDFEAHVIAHAHNQVAAEGGTVQ